jgi:hypothetical protein
VLDVRATHYVSPLSEVDFESVPLTVHITNVADETGLVTGKFRVYNDNTGLLIHTSDIVPLSLGPGAAADVSALTDFDPPAIADDLYFVIFDGNASNALVPDGISFALGAFHFDVKAQGMGPAPAVHAATHEEGGGDMIEVADMGTAELDDTLVLQPDGAGGVEWAAVPAGVTDHGALTGLADNDHPQYHLMSHCLVEDDMFVASTSHLYVFYFASINLGTGMPTTGNANHPGIIRFRSSTSANSGYYICTEPYGLNCIALGGGESHTLIFRPMTLSGTTWRTGYMRGATAVGTRGCYMESVNGTIVGKTIDGAGNSTTGTSYLTVTNTWYRAKIVLDANAARVDFYLYAENGTLLWSDFLTSNIPSTTDDMAITFHCSNSGTTAVDLVDVDYINFWINRTLVR